MSFMSSWSFLVAWHKSHFSAFLMEKLTTGLQWHAVGEHSCASAKEINTAARSRRYSLQFAISRVA